MGWDIGDRATDSCVECSNTFDRTALTDSSLPLPSTPLSRSGLIYGSSSVFRNLIMLVIKLVYFTGNFKNVISGRYTLYIDILIVIELYDTIYVIS